MNFSIYINEEQLLNKLKFVINKKLKTAIQLARPGIYRDVGILIESTIKSSPAYQSLLNGELRVLFGIKDPIYSMESLLRDLKRDIQIERNNRGSGLNISIIKSDLQNIINADYGVYFSNGNKVDWLNWLLAQGDKIVLADFDIQYVVDTNTSRTGQAIMVKGQGWRVPPQYSGLIGNNWITREIRSPKFQKSLIDIVKSNIIRNI